MSKESKYMIIPLEVKDAVKRMDREELDKMIDEMFSSSFVEFHTLMTTAYLNGKMTQEQRKWFEESNKKLEGILKRK